MLGTLIAIPILIQLINLVRHQTVEWAAMEFLLKSYRKNRNWVWLKQLLLLLSRIAMLVAALYLLGQVGCENDRLASMLGGNSTHHYVIVDDSFSMSDRDQRGSALDKARSAVLKIVSRGRNRSGHRFSLIKYSGFETSGDSVVPLFEVDDEQIDSAFISRLESVANSLTETALATTAENALKAVNERIAARSNQNAIVYLVSDFREKDFGENSSMAQTLESLAGAGAAVELIRCVERPRENLAITKLRAKGNVRVAETPLMMEVEVTNVSNQVARKVQVQVATSTFAAAKNVADFSVSSKIEDLPTVFIETVEPGQSVTREFPVYFAVPGKHAVTAALPDDVIPVDNFRFATVDVVSQSKILILDSAAAPAANYLSLALNPNQLTGIQSEIRTSAWLRDATADDLAPFDVVFCCDLSRFDDVAISNLEAHARAGGGVVFFLGPSTNLPFVNEKLFNNGNGLLPVELERAVELEERGEGTSADIVAQTHPIFAPVNSVKNSLLDLVLIKKVFAPSFAWLQNRGQSKVLASVRGEQDLPLVIEGQFGRGRTVAILTSAGPEWNNWMRNATFPPILLLLEDYLAAGRYSNEVSVAGHHLTVSQAAGTTTPDVTAFSPSGLPTETASQPTKTRLKMMPLPATDGQANRNAADFGSPMLQTNRETKLPGVYEFWFRKTDSTAAVDRVAINVDTVESEMAVVAGERLLSSLAAAQPSLVAWDKFNPQPQTRSVSTLSRILLLVMALLLVVEQFLAWMCSYHS